MVILQKDIELFVRFNGLSDVIYSSDLSKGQCDNITEKLKAFLSNMGYDNIYRIDLYNPKFDLTSAHAEWKSYKPEYLVHSVLLIDDLYVDLTGAQYSESMSGIKMYTLSEISKLWGNYKIMEKDLSDKYIGGN